MDSRQINVIVSVYRVFKKISQGLGWLNTRLLLIIIFYLIFTPIGLIMKLFREEPLSRKIEKEKSSYWLDKTFADTSDYYENQF